MTVFCARCDLAAAGTETDLPDGWELHTSGVLGTRYPVCGACLESSAGKSVKAGSKSSTDDQLRLFIERIERIEEDIKGGQDDRSDVYSEAKAVGYNVKIMREIVRLRRMNPHDRAERDAILDTYRTAIGV